MDSTMIYSLIEEQMHKEGELVNLLPTLAKQLSPNTKLSTHRMNQHQIFSQVHQCIKHLLQSKQKEKNALMQNLQSQQQANEEEQLSEVQQAQQDAEYDGPEAQEIQEQMVNQDIQEQDEQADQEEDGFDQEAFQGQEDVGIYGEEIDEQDMESYENQGNSEEDRQFQQEQQQLGKRSNRKQKQQDIQDEGDDIINDQFDHFRQIQMQKKQEQQAAKQGKNDLQKQIQRLEGKLISKKDWMLQGQVKSTQRPVNSLLETDLQFSTGIRLGQQITPEYNSDLETMIKQRILDELYDDRVRYQHAQVLRQHYSSLKEVSTDKSKMGLSELYESQFKNYLGIGENKQDKLKAEIMEAFKQVNYQLDSLSNFHFTPRPVAALKGDAVIVEERVPTAKWKGGQQQLTKITHQFETQKQENKQGKRLKNKRIERQRRKQRNQKKLNKKIEYGGMTKFEAKAIQKSKKNTLKQNTTKYNKSANFFGQMNKEKSSKPNANLSKLKL